MLVLYITLVIFLGWRKFREDYDVCNESFRFADWVQQSNLLQAGGFLATCGLQIYRTVSSQERLRFPGSWVTTLTINILGCISSILTLQNLGGVCKDSFG